MAEFTAASVDTLDIIMGFVDGRNAGSLVLGELFLC